jgi:hypothetical protein
MARTTISNRVIPREISRENSILIRDVNMVAGSLFMASLIYDKNGLAKVELPTPPLPPL